jgi:hypothetical protein
MVVVLSWWMLKQREATGQEFLTDSPGGMSNGIESPASRVGENL